MNTLPKNPLLEQFLSEARELLEGIGQKLMQLEEAPAIGASSTNSFAWCIHSRATAGSSHFLR